MHTGTKTWLCLDSKAREVIPERNDDLDVMCSTVSEVYDAEPHGRQYEWAPGRLMSPHELGEHHHTIWGLGFPEKLAIRPSTAPQLIHKINSITGNVRLCCSLLFCIV